MAANIYGVSQVNEITPGLYLTSVYGATKENINRKGVTLVVNAAQELPKQEINGVESIKLNVDDTPYDSIKGYFDRIADKIHEHSQSGGRSMVHCAAGVSRSTSLVLAYLMKYKNMSLQSAFDYVSAKRPIVKPNSGFWRQLQEYERTLGGSSSSGYGSSASSTAATYGGSGSSYAGSVYGSSSSRSRASRSSYNNYSSYNNNDYASGYGNDYDNSYDSSSYGGYNYGSNYDSSSYGRSSYPSNSYFDSSAYGSSSYGSSSYGSSSYGSSSYGSGLSTYRKSYRLRY